MSHPAGDTKIAFLKFIQDSLINFLTAVLRFLLGLRKDRNEIVLPRATYAPWKLDRAFHKLFNQVVSRTLLDRYRLYYIYEACNKVKPLAGDSIEIGVWRGGGSALIAKQLDTSTHYVCDTFSGIVRTGGIDSKYKDGMHDDTSIDTVIKLFEKVGVDNYKLLKGIFPDDTIDQMDSQKIKFAHIDTDTYLSTKKCFEAVWPMLVDKAQVIIDDYGIHDNEGIREFVEKDLEAYGDQIVKVRLLSGQCLVVKR